MEPVLKRAVAEFPAIILTGPRQAGKTTLLQQHFSEKFRYVSLEPPDIHASANEDPRSFLKTNPPPVIFDEIQYASDLLPYIKEAIDANRNKNGQYLLTGSQTILLMKQITESLAGLKDPSHAAAGPMGGAIMETAVLSEIIKTLTHRGIDPRVYFWRTTAGTEVDCVVEAGDNKLVPLEVKLSATPRIPMASAVKTFQKDIKKKAMQGYVVHPGDTTLPLGPNVTALPFSKL